VLNYGDALEELVIADFVREYAAGRTPNPCVRCNRLLKFDRLFDDARALGATHLATGHYAQIVFNGATGEHELHKGLDRQKDQSYFLYATPRERLPFLLFPAGEYTKADVRAVARRFALPVAAKKESQDICFIAGGKYQDFLAGRLGEALRCGPFIDAAGQVVGEHKGIARYTVGQREGLGIALGRPVYVGRIDPAANAVHLVDEPGLYCAGVEASQLNLLAGNFLQETVEAHFKIRYNQNEIAGAVTFLGGGRIRAVFREPQKAAAPGQGIVIYDGTRVTAGALIDRPC
jgi:tRNA-specific 2-thiouridylase